LDEANAAFVQGGVSVVAASRDAALVPSIARVSGCRVSTDRRAVTLYIASSQASQLIADVSASGRIAVVFSQPSTHRTLQLKADRARVRAIRKAEVSIVERYVAAFASEIEPLGHTTEQARTLLECHENDLVAVDFVPSAAFEQTPGPKAGTPLPTTR
jgi:acyl-CoA synthetase (AMP-forming)/AMP-acid ligase II